ncbi:MAG TPA: VCBS repeat-containing protein, partial [Pyrinomonadaceae bacterium]|nr:VCBS repeat-containing protein [Pyrinomonadaceae bacterium]
MKKNSPRKRRTSVNTHQSEESGKDPDRYGKRALVVLSLFVLLTFGIGAIASWRGSRSPNSPVPFSTPPPMPAAQPAREYVYAGSALVSSVEPFYEPPSDLGVWRPSNGTWYILNSTTQQSTSQQWGISTDIAAPGDFDGDGKTDFCVFRAGTWYIIQSSNGANSYPSYGSSGDIPAVGDYDGDGRTDPAVYWPAT